MSFKLLRLQFLQTRYSEEVNRISLKTELQATLFVLTQIQTVFMLAPPFTFIQTQDPSLSDQKKNHWGIDEQWAGRGADLRALKIIHKGARVWVPRPSIQLILSRGKFFVKKFASQTDILHRPRPPVLNLRCDEYLANYNINLRCQTIIDFNNNNCP